MIKRLKKLIPPDKWFVPVFFLVAIAVGMVFYLVYISKAHSYLSDEPETCVNCHIMAPQYATWSHSSHREVATCNDCHVPHDNIINKYYFKAKDGMRHATIFTLRREPQVIFIRDEGREVVQQNCVRCHQNLLVDDQLATYNTHFNHQRTEKKCWDCHREVPHGRVNSLSSVPHARVPLPESPVPEWLKEQMKNLKSE
ncbi:MAG: cytochrome c nitrite reductase small subunit [Bacteroidetes bacterium]|jgi:cytochrome c nitrite reductase small subunit|nr:cytochrome c nitrite reductase small subunit [Bacteroidota bacterium]